MIVEKTNLRKEYLEKRQNLSRSAYWALNENLLSQIEKFDWDRINIVHIFLPIKHHNEVDTYAIIDYLKNYYPQIQVVLPRTDFNNLKMENVLFDSLHTVLRQNEFGIPEPVYGKIVDPLTIDAVFMPLLAYDKVGNRVGYGKGFYDRFILLCKESVLKIGLSLFEPVEGIIDVNEHDSQMDGCISAQRIWTFHS